MRTWPVVARSPVFPIAEGRALLFLAVLLALISTVSCSANDRAERSTRRVHSSQRVLSLLPAATEVLVALGAQERLVARTDYDDSESLRVLPSLGRDLEAGAESVLGLAPDLVIFPAFTRVPAHLLELLDHKAATVLRPELQTLTDLYVLIDTLGVVLDLRPQASVLRDRIAGQLTEIQRSAGPDSLRVLYLIWPTPPRVAAAGTFVNELLNIAGARNAVSDLRGWPEVSLEEIIRRDPDLIILSIDDAQKVSPDVLSQQTGWKETRAVRNDRVVAVSGDLFNRPGTRVVAAAQLLADAVRRARRSGQ